MAKQSSKPDGLAVERNRDFGSTRDSTRLRKPIRIMKCYREKETLMKNKTRYKTTGAPALPVDGSMSREEQIARRAHELWDQRGRQDGSDLADWFRAEREVNEWHQQRLGNHA